MPSSSAGIGFFGCGTTEMRGRLRKKMSRLTHLVG